MPILKLDKQTTLTILASCAATLIELCLLVYIRNPLMSHVETFQDFSFLLPSTISPILFVLTILLAMATNLTEFSEKRKIAKCWSALLCSLLVASLFLFLWSYNLRPIVGIGWPGVVYPVVWKVYTIELIGLISFIGLSFVFIGNILDIKYNFKNISVCICATIVAVIAENSISGIWWSLLFLTVWQVIVVNTFIYGRQPLAP